MLHSYPGFGGDSDPLSLTTWQFTVAAVASGATVAVRWGTGAQRLPAAVPPRFWLAAVLIAVAGYGASFLVFNSVISRVGAAQSAVVLNLIPVFAFVGATVFLGEPVNGGNLLGAALVGLSVVYFTVADHRAAAQPA